MVNLRLGRRSGVVCFNDNCFECLECSDSDLLLDSGVI